VNLEKYLVVAGVPGVHKLIASRANGVVIEDRKEKRTRFVPARQQQITPIATVGIYTDTEEGTVSLTDVFQKMLDQFAENPPVSLESNSAEFRAYFTSILPEHDRDRVHINDIKKCIKWFNFMRENGIFEEAKREAEANAPAEKTEEPATEKPAETKAVDEKAEKPAKVKTKAKA
jgi:hypothetical protein